MNPYMDRTWACASKGGMPSEISVLSFVCTGLPGIKCTKKNVKEQTASIMINPAKRRLANRCMNFFIVPVPLSDCSPCPPVAITENSILITTRNSIHLNTATARLAPGGKTPTALTALYAHLLRYRSLSAQFFPSQSPQAQPGWFRSTHPSR